MKRKIVLALGAMSLSISAAHAAVGVSAELGTTGIGVHATLPVIDNLNARIGVNAFNYSYDGKASNVDYDFKLQLQTFDLLADYHPITDSGFRLTGGLIYNDNKIEANGKPSANNASYTLNGTTYTTASVGSLNGKIDFSKVVPYAGLGWGNALAKDSNWSFSADLGVIFQGAANSSLTISNCALPAVACARLANDLVEENKKLNDKMSDYKIYPVIRVGLAYKF